MSKVDRINYDKDLVIKMVSRIINQTPGVSNGAKNHITINSEHTVINISFVPESSFYNVANIAGKIQENVYFQLLKAFDLYKLVVNVTARRKKNNND